MMKTKKKKYSSLPKSSMIEKRENPVREYKKHHAFISCCLHARREPRQDIIQTLSMWDGRIYLQLALSRYILGSSKFSEIGN
jgi:hypothetical protein